MPADDAQSDIEVQLRDLRQKHGETVTLEVIDTGIGMSTEEQKIVFSEFTRLKAKLNIGISDSSTESIGSGMTP